MNVLDVNLLVALFRAEHVHHDRAVRWWEETERTGASFTIPDVVAVGFCRLTTNPRVYTTPASFAEAADFLEVLGSHDLCLRYASDQRTLAHFLELGRREAVRASLVPDTYIASCALALGATVVTFDRDFRRFDDLKVLEPR